MADGRHLEISKIAISQPQFEQFRHNLACRRISTLLNVPTVKNLKFPKSKMAAAAILKNRKSAISPERFHRSSQNVVDDAYWASEWDRKLKFPTFENPRWRTAAILKNRKIAISLPRFKRFRQNLARRRSSTLLSVSTVKNLKFPKKMAASAILKNRKSAIETISINSKVCSCQKCHTPSRQK